MSPKLLAVAVALAGLTLPATAWSFKLQKPEMTQKGTFTFGGGLSLASVTTVTDVDGVPDDVEADVLGINIAPSFGYFVIDGLEIGLLASLERTSTQVTEPSNGDEFVDSLFGIGLYGAYYFPWLKGNAMFPYVGASFRYLTGSETIIDPADPTDTAELDRSGTDIRPGIGLMLAIGSRSGGWMKLGVDYQLQSITTEFDGDETQTVDTQGFVVGMGFGLYLR